jgi:hypothetical protein
MRKSLIVALAAALSSAVLMQSTTAAADGGGKRTLADVLLADSRRDDAAGFDWRPWDYDIVTQAVLLFPDLAAAAGDPNAQLTVFLPNDQAFRVLVRELTGEWVWSEGEVFAAVASLGTDTVLSVLQYHIVPQAISYRDAKQADGAVLGTLLADAPLTVDVTGWWKSVRLVDLDVDDRDATVVAPNVGGSLANGYAHGVDRVLRPTDLP